MLPIRVKDIKESRFRAFSVHIEERPSALAVFSPLGVIMLIALIPTLPFIPYWLYSHPDDLQNATTPTVIMLGLAAVISSFWTSLLNLRWAGY